MWTGLKFPEGKKRRLAVCEVGNKLSDKLQEDSNYSRYVQKVGGQADRTSMAKMAASICNELLPEYERFDGLIHAGRADNVDAPGPRRRLVRDAGRAVEILGHAIEYLADEYVRENSPASSKEGMLEAIQILMSLNREIYLAAPEAPTVMQWLRGQFSW
jgi:hypothetical protein